jgi:signal transduction histidine kinase
MALHGSSPGVNAEEAHAFLTDAVARGSAGSWWYGQGRLYQVFVHPIFFGNPAENRLLGFLGSGYEIDERVAQEVSRVASSQVAFRYGDSIVRSTLDPVRTDELQKSLASPTLGEGTASGQLKLGSELFLATSVELAPGNVPTVKLSVLKSFDQETAFLNHLNRLLLSMSLLAVAGGSLLVYFISSTFTRPLKTLVAGVRALEHGDYTYPLSAQGNDEVAEVSSAFEGMRTSLRSTQQELMDAERLATIGRMASSISHDLRHSLASILANSEFLCEIDLKASQREELYQEVRAAVDRMNDLIESLLEFSRTRESLRPSFASATRIVERAIHAVKAHPAYQEVNIEVASAGACEGWFDSGKLERAFQNLILNSCEAISRHPGSIQIEMHSADEILEILVSDNGTGISPTILPKLFEPFVSFGKQNGTGMGLTVVQKIVQDHGGDIVVQSTSPQGTVFRLRLPLYLFAETRVEMRPGVHGRLA